MNYLVKNSFVTHTYYSRRKRQSDRTSMKIEVNMDMAINITKVEAFHLCYNGLIIFQLTIQKTEY